MRRGARSLPTVEPEPGDVVPPAGEEDPAAESPLRSQPAGGATQSINAKPERRQGQHRA